MKQEAARQDPDKAEYRVLIKQYKLMESTKEAGNRAFKAQNIQVQYLTIVRSYSWYTRYCIVCSGYVLHDKYDVGCTNSCGDGGGASVKLSITAQFGTIVLFSLGSIVLAPPPPD